MRKKCRVEHFPPLPAQNVSSLEERSSQTQNRTPGKKVTVEVRWPGEGVKFRRGKATYKRPRGEGLGKSRADNAPSVLPSSVPSGWTPGCSAPILQLLKVRSHLPPFLPLPAAGVGKPGDINPSCVLSVCSLHLSGPRRRLSRL